MADVLIREPIVRVPRGMVTSTPRNLLPPDVFYWAENFNLSEQSLKTRRGFKKYNRYALPLSGLRLNGTDQYLDVPKSASGDTVFETPSATRIVISIAFILEDLTTGSSKFAHLIGYGTESAGWNTTAWAIEVVRNADDVIQVQFRTGTGAATSTMSTAFTSDPDNSIKTGIGYRVVMMKDASTDDWRLLVYSQKSSTAIANVGPTTMSKRSVGTDVLQLGKSFNSSDYGWFKGILQDVQFWSGMSALPAYTNAEDPIRVRSDTELDDQEAADSNLKLWLKLEDSDNATVQLTDSSGDGYHAMKRPALPEWVSDGLIDNAPVTYSIKLDPSQVQYLLALDQPSALGASIFDQVRLNTTYEFGVSIAFKIDGEYIARKETDNAAPTWLPLFYYGDRGASDEGLRVDVTGDWAIWIALENAGSVSASDYRLVVAIVDEDGTRKAAWSGSAFGKQAVVDIKYRLDLIRDKGRYLYARLYKDGEQYIATDGREERFDLGAAYATKKLQDTTFSNGGCFIFGLSLDGATPDKYYFPGQIDDLRVFSINPEDLPAENNVSMHQWDGLAGTDNRLVFYARLNEGKGKYFTDNSAYNNNLATATGTVGEYHQLMPNGNDMPTHGAGWVKPNRYNRSMGLIAYKDIETRSGSVFVVAGGAVWQSQADDGASLVKFTPIYHGLTRELPMSFAHVNNQLVMGDGVNPTLRYDGKSIDLLGIDAPGTAPGTTALGSGGSLSAGTYKYVYSWKNSKTGGRSNPSPSASVTVVNNDKVNVTAFTPDISSDLGVLGIDTVEIWRTKVGGATYYWVADVKIPNRDGTQAGSSPGVSGVVMSPYGDTTADSALSSTVLSSITAYGRLPKCRYYVSAKGRLVGCYQEAYPNRIVWCELHYPDHHDPAKQFSDDIDSGDGDEITGAVYTNDIVYVFQRRSVWAILGIESEDTIRVVHLFSGVGCVDQSTIQVIAGTILWRGEDNFYRLDPGGTQPEPVGTQIKNLLELADSSADRLGTSGVLRQEGIYLCSVTDATQSAVDSNVRNTHIFAFNLYTGAWTIWTLPFLGHFANLELNGVSELFALMRNGFVYRYSGRGADNANVTYQITHAEGLARGKRAWFTLKAQVDVSATPAYIDVNEADSTVDTTEDGMKGLRLAFKLDDDTWSSNYYIRKVVSISGGLRIFLTEGVSSGESDDASIGNEVHVGGFLKKLITADISAGDVTREKEAWGLSVVGEGNGVPPVPVKAPSIKTGTSGTTYEFAYAYQTSNGVEGRLSPAVGTTARSVVLVLEAPDVDLGSNVDILVYVREVGVTVFKKVATIDGASYQPGEKFEWTDPGSGESGNYDPDTKNSLVWVTGWHQVRGGQLVKSDELNERWVDMSGWDEWRISGRARGNIFRYQIENPYPNANFEIHQLFQLYSWMEMARE